MKNINVSATEKTTNDELSKTNLIMRGVDKKFYCCRSLEDVYKFDKKSM